MGIPPFANAPLPPRGGDGKAIVSLGGKVVYGRPVGDLARVIVLGSSRAVGDSAGGTITFTNGVVQQSQNSWFSHFCWGGQQVKMIRNAGLRGDIIGATTTLSQAATAGDTVLHISTFRGAYPPTSLGVHIYTGKKGAAGSDDCVILSVNTGAQTLTLNTPLLSSHAAGTIVGWGFVSRFITDVMDYYPDKVFLECGGANDVNNSTTANQMSDLLYWLEYMSVTMKKRGIDVIHTLEPGRPVYAASDATFAKLVTAWADTNQYSLVDVRNLLMDSQSGIYSSTYSNDGIHVSLYGAQAQAQYTIDWWSAHRETRGDYIPLTTQDADPINMPSYGTLSGSGNSGGTPQGWTLTNFFATGMTASIVDATDATNDPNVRGKLWKVVMSGVGNGSLSIKQTIAAAADTWAPGDNLWQGYYVKVSGFSTNTATYSIGVLYDGDGSVHQPQVSWNIDYEGRIWNEGAIIPAAATNVKPFVIINGGGTGSGTIWVGQLTVVNATLNGFTYRGQF